jgi:hypothetical protein
MAERRKGFTGRRGAAEQQQEEEEANAAGEELGKVCHVPP